ncbi:MAG: hypothetical protein NTZ50_09965, partial [Chloroflexi bacterium]|nr:hypothetical protein [Chloroflexota bacterium]
HSLNRFLVLYADRVLASVMLHRSRVPDAASFSFRTVGWLIFWLCHPGIVPKLTLDVCSLFLI